MKYLSVILFSIWLASGSYGKDTLQNTSLSRDSIRTVLSQMNDVGDYKSLDNMLIEYGWTPEIIQELSLALETCSNEQYYIYNLTNCLLHYIEDYMPYPFSVKSPKVYNRPDNYVEVRSGIINTFGKVIEENPYKAYKIITLLNRSIPLPSIDPLNWSPSDRKVFFTSFLRSIQKYYPHQNNFSGETFPILNGVTFYSQGCPLLYQYPDKDYAPLVRDILENRKALGSERKFMLKFLGKCGDSTQYDYLQNEFKNGEDEYKESALYGLSYLAEYLTESQRENYSVFVKKHINDTRYRNALLPGIKNSKIEGLQSLLIDYKLYIENNKYYQKIEIENYQRKKQSIEREKYSNPGIINELMKKVYNADTINRVIDCFDTTIDDTLMELSKGGEPGARALIKLFETKKNYSAVYNPEKSLYPLGCSGTTTGFDYLMALSENTIFDSSLRVGAIANLSYNILWYTPEQKEKIFKLLIQNLYSKNYIERQCCVNALGRLDNIDAIPYLEPLLNDEYSFTSGPYWKNDKKVKDKITRYPVKESAIIALDHLNVLKKEMVAYSEYTTMYPEN